MTKPFFIALIIYLTPTDLVSQFNIGIQSELDFNFYLDYNYKPGEEIGKNALAVGNTSSLLIGYDFNERFGLNIGAGYSRKEYSPKRDFNTRSLNTASIKFLEIPISVRYKLFNSKNNNKLSYHILLGGTYQIELDAKYEPIIVNKPVPNFYKANSLVYLISIAGQYQLKEDIYAMGMINFRGGGIGREFLNRKLNKFSLAIAFFKSF